MRFIFTRHTTTDWNAVKRLQGQTDTELNEIGRREAAGLVLKLKGLGIVKIVSSDLKRAQQTAEILAGALGVPLTVDARLRECAFGSLEGFTREEVVAQHGPMLARYFSDYSSYDFRPFGGECRDEVVRRHRHALDEHSNSSETLLVVGHSRGLHTMLMSLGDRIPLPRGEYRIVEWER